MAFKIADTFYVAHGSPTLSIDETTPARSFLQSFRTKVFTLRPKAILIISSHWDTDEPYVNVVVDRNDTIYDFDGVPVPEPMYKLKYPAPGAPEVAQRVKELLTASGFGPVRDDKKRGLDHGAWVPLMLMYPEADIPVCQLSVQSKKDAIYHYNMGKALAPLKDEGILIVGSGSTTHNLKALNMRINNGRPEPWAAAFDTWLKEALVSGRYDDVNKWSEHAPNAKMAHPWPDHFYPLHVAMGAAGDGSKAKQIHSSWGAGTLSYSSYQFTSAS